MGKQVSTRLAGVALVCCVAVLSGMLYLVFIFPRTEASWANLGRELSAFQRAIVDLSNFCKQSACFVLPVILLLAAGSLAWLIISLRSKHHENRQQ